MRRNVQVHLYKITTSSGLNKAELKGESITVYPNPANDHITFGTAGCNTDAKIFVYNILF